MQYDSISTEVDVHEPATPRPDWGPRTVDLVRGGSGRRHSESGRSIGAVEIRLGLSMRAILETATDAFGVLSWGVGT